MSKTSNPALSGRSSALELPTKREVPRSSTEQQRECSGVEQDSNDRGSYTSEISKQRARMSAAGYTTREKMYAALNSFPVQLVIMLLVFVDIAILLYQIAKKDSNGGGVDCPLSC